MLPGSVEPNSEGQERIMEVPILSPITGRPDTEQVGSVRASEIVEIYRRYFGIDISDHVPDIGEIRIMRCRDSGFMFYHPFTLEGSDAYYKMMSQFEWYYHPNRWEHEKALELIGVNDQVLEVGSGSGHFLKQLHARGIRAQGLELNPRGIEQAKAQGIELINETVQDHAQTHAGKYTVVCSFQVLEHVSDPLPFLRAKLECLQPDGKLIIGVPNNDSYIKHNKMDSRVLNMPPHHMGLWTLESLKGLEKVLAVRLTEVHYEPLVDGNVSVYAWNRLNNLLFDISILTRSVWKLAGDRFIVPLFRRFSHRVHGSSMLAVFNRDRE